MAYAAVSIATAILLQVAASSAQECTWQKYQTCAGDLDSLGLEIAPHLTESQLNDLCNKYEEKRPCIEDLTKTCKSETEEKNNEESGDEAHTERDPRAVQEGALNQQNDTATDAPATSPRAATTVRAASSTPSPTTYSYQEEQVDGDYRTLMENKKTTQALLETTNAHEFVCDSARRSAYQQVRPCLDENSVTLKAASDDCMNAYHNATWWLNVEEQLNVYKFCSAALDYLKCQEEAARKTCGDDQAAWVKDYQQALWQAHLDDIACSAGGGMEPGAIAIVSLCSAGAIMAVIFVAASFIAKDSDPRVKAEKAKKAEQAQKVNGAYKPDKDEAKDSKEKNGLSTIPEQGILKRRNTSDITPL